MEMHPNREGCNNQTKSGESRGERIQLRAPLLGLMLGEFVVGITWMIIGMLLGIRTYDFWP